MNESTKFLFSATLLSLILLSLTFSFSDPSERPTILATTLPLKEMAQTIVGPDRSVISIIPLGAEPHSFEPSPRTIELVQNARSFITIGLEFQPIEQSISRTNPQLNIIDATTGITLSNSAPTRQNTNRKDPHIWISPKNMKVIVRTIATSLQSQYPESSATLRQNTDRLLSKLNDLDQEFTQTLSSCDKDTIFVNHLAFTYLARDYHFKQISVFGAVPETNPTPKQLAAAIFEAKQNNISYVFADLNLDPRISEVIANDLGAKLLFLNPALGPETYFTAMSKNLNNLKIALDCRNEI